VYLSSLAVGRWNGMTVESSADGNDMGGLAGLVTRAFMSRLFRILLQFLCDIEDFFTCSEQDVKASTLLIG